VENGSLDMAVYSLCEYYIELTSSLVCLKCLHVMSLDWSFRFGSELSYQDPVWGARGGLACHGGPSALCWPLVSSDHKISPSVLKHHSH